MRKKIFIPKDAPSWKYNREDFTECTSIEVDPENPELYSHNNLLIYKKDNALCYACGNYSIPPFVKSICFGAFYGRKDVGDLLLPDTVEFVAPGAFENSGIKSITLPKMQAEIGAETFANCADLVAVKIISNITDVRYRAFFGCKNLTHLDLPDSVTCIGWAAFKECASLESIHLAEGLREIQTDVFYGCKKLKSITIPESVESISGGAFFCCCALESVKLPHSLKTISESTFYRCTNLKNVEIPYGVTEIQRDAFSECTSLQSIYIPSSVTNIGGVVFPAQGDDGYSLTIYGGAGSCAEEYARRHGYNFVAIEET